jgi:hypothetical protein
MAQDNMLKTAEAEVLRLEDELAKSTLGQKLALAKQVVDLYQKHALNQIVNGHLARVRTERVVLAAPETAPSTKTAKVERACADYLRGRKKRATSGELLGVVDQAGIKLSGVMPVKSLAAILSNSELFDNIRDEGGYGLVEWSQRHQGEGIETATSQ